jgi:hypothetical protein
MHTINQPQLESSLTDDVATMNKAHELSYWERMDIVVWYPINCVTL